MPHLDFDAGHFHCVEDLKRQTAYNRLKAILIKAGEVRNLVINHKLIAALEIKLQIRQAITAGRCGRRKLLFEGTPPGEYSHTSVTTEAFALCLL